MDDYSAIYEKARQARVQRFLTNCYRIDLLEKADRIWERGEAFVFSYRDHGISRLIYFAQDWSSLDDLLDGIGAGKWFLEYMTKDPDEYHPSSGRLVTRMLRMANPDCRGVFGVDSQVAQYRSASKTELATEEDAEELTTILWKTFRPEISHLLYADELKPLIQAGQVTVHRTDGRIDALLQADVMPKKFYINQIVNLGERKHVHALLLDRLEKYVAAGGKYLYAWVDETNIASIKFHNKYGMKVDGMMSVIYCIER